MTPRVRVRSFSVSSDGVGAGENQTLERPFSDVDVGVLHAWAFATASFPAGAGPGGSRGLEDYVTRNFAHGIGVERGHATRPVAAVTALRAGLPRLLSASRAAPKIPLRLPFPIPSLVGSGSKPHRGGTEIVGAQRSTHRSSRSGSPTGTHVASLDKGTSPCSSGIS